MVTRSLSHVFRIQDRKIGYRGTQTGGPEKLVKSSNTGERIVVPGHVSDVIFQNDKKVIEPDIDRLTGANWNWERFYIRRIANKDRMHDAVAEYDPTKKAVRAN